ncbi:MAG: hypothetical protein ACPG7U_02090 [Holosporaceae bacterium]
MTDQQVNVYTQSSMANVLVFHEFKAPPNVLKAWVEDVKKFFAEHKMAPVWGGVNGKNGYKTSKWVKAKSAFNRLENLAIQGLVVCFCSMHRLMI